MARYSNTTLDAFEIAHGIVLPRAYRELLTTIAVGRLWSWNGWGVPPLMMIEEWYDDTEDKGRPTYPRIVELGCGYYLAMDLEDPGRLSLETDSGSFLPLHRRGARLVVADLARLAGRIAVSRAVARHAKVLRRWFAR